MPEAARLSSLRASRIRRWLTGYEFKGKDQVRTSPPVWRRDLPVIDGALALSFLSFRDLVEVRFVNAFREHGSMGLYRINLSCEASR